MPLAFAAGRRCIKGMSMSAGHTIDAIELLTDRSVVEM